MSKALWSCLAAAAFAAGVSAVDNAGGYLLANVYDRPTGAETSPELNQVRESSDNYGGMVYFYVVNSGTEPVSLSDIVWDGHDAIYWSGEAGDWQLVWQLARPEVIPAGGTGEIALCLRRSLAQATEFELRFSDGGKAKYTVFAGAPSYRLMTAVFDAGLANAYLYFTALRPDAAVPEQISVNGRAARVKWLAPGYASATRVAKVAFDRPLERGERVTFLAADRNGGEVVGTSLRAFADLSVFGTYGGFDLRRYAANGLSAYNSFWPLSDTLLDLGELLGVKSIYGSHLVDPATAGHPALAGYLLMDEPDCHDYGKEGRPLNRRVGQTAAEVLERYQNVVANDPSGMAMLTLDLTFTPFNYFFYAPVADLTNPDIYTNTLAWSVKYVDNHLSLVKRSVAPRPFSFTYQSYWEEWELPGHPWIGKEKLLADGIENYRDTSRPARGFGYNTNPDEIALAMHYGLGNGAVALFAYIDATEATGLVISYGTDVVPENWQAVGLYSRTLRHAASLFGLAHPLAHAAADNPKMWVKTLLTGEDAALVVAVNENYEYAPERFIITPESANFSFAALPWLAGKLVYRLEESGFAPVTVRTEGHSAVWRDTVRNGAVYLIVDDPAVFERIAADGEARRARQQRGIEADALAAAARDRQTEFMREKGEPVSGFAVNGYLDTVADIAASGDGAYNAFSCWEQNGVTPLGAEWKFAVAPAEVDAPVAVMWEGNGYGAKATLTLTGPDGEVVWQKRADISRTEARHWDFMPKQSGEYLFRVVVEPEAAIEHGGRFGLNIFVHSSSR